MIFDVLPPFVEGETYYEDSDRLEHQLFYLTAIANDDRTWSVGYAMFDHEGDFIAIPQLNVLHADSLHQAAIRMKAKLERFEKLSNS